MHSHKSLLCNPLPARGEEVNIDVVVSSLHESRGLNDGA